MTSWTSVALHLKQLNDLNSCCASCSGDIIVEAHGSEMRKCPLGRVGPSSRSEFSTSRTVTTTFGQYQSTYGSQLNLRGSNSGKPVNFGLPQLNLWGQIANHQALASLSGPLSAGAVHLHQLKPSLARGIDARSMTTLPCWF